MAKNSSGWQTTGSGPTHTHWLSVVTPLRLSMPSCKGPWDRSQAGAGHPGGQRQGGPDSLMTSHHPSVGTGISSHDQEGSCMEKLPLDRQHWANTAR